MSLSYKLVQWTPHKRVYDFSIGAGVFLYLVCFLVVGRLSSKNISDEVLILRGLGTCAMLMLHVILCIGPLCRLDRRFLPLLFNRRHLGVAMFVISFAHGLLSLGYYHGFGNTSPLTSLLTANVQFRSLSAFPFEFLGVAALAILFVMAATSHDFWLKNLSPRTWKALHMGVYVAWGLLIMHVALGALQSEPSILYPILLGGGALLVISLHIAAGMQEQSKKTAITARSHDWIEVAKIDEICEGRAKVVRLPTLERVAIFRHEGKLSALSNVCAHQQGPLGEGRIVNGCVTCPWHGYQYHAHDGCSPPPFSEKVPTYRLHLEGDRVFVDPRALPPGTPVPPLHTAEAADAS